jgi:hypothetical protein
MWEPFPASQCVADQQQREYVKGMACEVQGADKKDRTMSYEGDNYDEIKCLINLVTEDGESDYILTVILLGSETRMSGVKDDLTWRRIKLPEQRCGMPRSEPKCEEVSLIMGFLQLCIRILACHKPRSKLCKTTMGELHIYSPS